MEAVVAVPRHITEEEGGSSAVIVAATGGEEGSGINITPKREAESMDGSKKGHRIFPLGQT